MDDPVKEIEDVIRSITEPYEARVIAENIEKPVGVTSQLASNVADGKRKDNGSEDLKGIYKWLRIQSLDNKIEFHAVMFNGDKTRGAIELTEHMTMRLNPIARLRGSRVAVRFVVRIDLRICEDGKYRIYRQEDNFTSDLTRSGFDRIVPGSGTVNNVVKGSAGFLAAKLGKFLLAYNWFGP